LRGDDAGEEIGKLHRGPLRVWGFEERLDGRDEGLSVVEELLRFITRELGNVAVIGNLALPPRIFEDGADLLLHTSRFDEVAIEEESMLFLVEIRERPRFTPPSSV
jgi:hypothetical protein